MRVEIDQVKKENYDLIVIGAGPAGIILAIEYERLRPNDHILLVEFGFNFTTSRNRLDDTICVKNATNHHPPYECTNKGVGGTSATWGGRCAMYDEIDFMRRDILEGQCTWDITLFHEIRKYADQAAKYFECGDGTFNLEEIPIYAGSRIAENFQSGCVTDSVIERWSIPTRFGKRYGTEINRSRAIHLLTGWEAFLLAAPTGNGAISAITMRNFSGTHQAKISARKIVLAAGAQETTRLLLKNRHIFERAGGYPSSLGKYYQGHISGKIASVRFYGKPRKTDYGFLRDADGVYMRRRFQLSTEALLKHNLLNTAIWLDNPLYVNPKHRNGAMSFMYLAMITPGLGKRLAPPAVVHSITKNKINNVPEHIGNVIKDFPKSLITPAMIFLLRYCIRRKLPGVFLYSPRNTYALHFHAEQVPIKENRMELAADGETLTIHYKLADSDVDSVIRTHEILDEWLRRCRCGELIYWHSKKELPATIHSISKDGVHQVGTTRIAENSRDGVVDRNLKVWGLSNLYACSSSVFPTSSQANPTFFLGALAIRLARYFAADAVR
ncbi:MAG TPA: GMC oxidoreductase [Verrucomicrobiae bacterium]|jgi:hypothetical protein